MKTLDYKSKYLQFFISVFSVLVVSLICYLLKEIIGYRTVALLLLATVFILSVFLKFYPVLVSAFLSALIYDFFFIPPHFTLHIKSSEDVLMLLMYFIIAIINGTITSKLRQYEKMLFEKKEKQNANNLYKTILESISHELRTPISTIVGASDNLLEEKSNFSELDKNNLISEISIAALRLNRLVENLLNMQRLESGFLKIKLDWCDVSELINFTVNRIKNDFKNHVLKVDIENEIPLIKLDFGLIEQTLYNILHNSILYSPTGSTIYIHAKFENNLLLITIKDEGKGFSDEELQNIFTKFYRGKNSSTGGIGLGLSIAKGFIEAHNGKIKVENGLKIGAVFKISIPSVSFEITDSFEIKNDLNE